MNILIPAWSFYPSQEGGPSNALYWLASGLAKAGYTVRVVATNRCLNAEAVIVNRWIKLNEFDVIYAPVEMYWSYLNDELNKCDVLISNGVCLLKSFKLNIQALRLNKRVILSPRGELFDSAVFHKGRLYGFLKRVVFYIMKLVYGKKILFHATSLEEERAIYHYMGERARVFRIPNYMILPDKITATVPSEPYLLYLGRLNHIKNIDKILSGLARSSAFMSGSFIIKIAGEKRGEYYESLAKQNADLGLSKKVEFLGMVTGKEKDVLYANAKCLLLMSKSENFGNVIVESLAQGTPVIASKGTPWQQLNEKGAGWCIDAEPDEIAKTVDELLRLDNKQYSEMRDNAYQYSKEFDIYENIKHWTDVLDKLGNCS